MLAPLSVAALNHLLSQADWARTKLAPFAGRNARLAMPPWRLDLTIREDGYVEAATGTESDVADVIMTLPANAPLLALQGQEKVIAAARVEGNAHLATELSFVLRNLRWDAEEDLSKAVGDIAARRMVQGATGFVAWQRQAAVNLAENIAEYLTEESPTLAKPADVAVFGEELARFRDELSRLDKRVERLTLAS